MDMKTILGLAALAIPLMVDAADCTVKSGPRTNALVELYTSEGCSSCPPADRWIARFAGAHPVAGVVPIAFHVHYWDYIGWKDTFADPRFTERQRDFAKAGGARSVYTPQVVVAGRDFPEWRDADGFAGAIDTITHKPARATLSISPSVKADGTLHAQVSATLASGVKHADLALFVVPTQGGLGNDVTAGENRGEKLRHEYVVRSLAAIERFGDVTPVEFTPRIGWNPERMAIVAFVQNVKTGEVLQALSAPVCR